MRGILLRVKCRKAFLHAGIVDTQELVLGSGHIDKIWLTLGAFLLEKLVHQLICWGFSQVGADDLPNVRSSGIVSTSFLQFLNRRRGN